MKTKLCLLAKQILQRSFIIVGGRTRDLTTLDNVTNAQYNYFKVSFMYANCYGDVQYPLTGAEFWCLALFFFQAYLC